MGACPQGDFLEPSLTSHVFQFQLSDHRHPADDPQSPMSLNGLANTWRNSSALTRWRLLFAGVVVLWALYLVFAPKPWTVDLEGKHRVLNYWIVYSWVAAAIGMCAAAFLWLLSPWWAGKSLKPVTNYLASPRWFWPLIAVAMILQIVFAIPRMNDGFWDDEELNVRRSILGNYKLREGDEPVKFQRLDWSSTALEYREPNNHVLNSLLSRGVHDLYRAVSGDRGLPFTEWPMRVPALVAGVLSIASIAWMLLVFGMPRAGVLAAYLACLHPWYLRYTSECRGYAFALLLFPVILALWHRTVFRGTWGSWIALGVAQLAMVYAYPGTLFILVVMNVFAVPVLIVQRNSAEPIFVNIGRWFCTNTITAIVAMPLLFPLLPQMSKYLQFQSEQAFVMGWAWTWNTLNYFLCGVPWLRGSTNLVAYPEVVFTFGSDLWLHWLFMALVAVFLVAGVLRFSKVGPLGWAVVVTIFLPPVMTFLLFRIKTQIIYESYVIYALPGALAVVATGMVWLFEKLPLGKSHPRMVWGQIAVFVVAYASLTQPTRAWMMNNPLQQLPESVIACRGTLDPSDSSNDHILTGSFCIPPYLYDPKMIRLDSTQEFVEFLKKADSENRPLLINIGMPWAAREYSPGMWALLNDPKLFELPTVFRGWDPGLDRMVFKFRPGSSTSFDFSSAVQKPR